MTKQNMQDARIEILNYIRTLTVRPTAQEVLDHFTPKYPLMKLYLVRQILKSSMPNRAPAVKHDKTKLLDRASIEDVKDRAIAYWNSFELKPTITSVHRYVLEYYPSANYKLIWTTINALSK